MALRILVLLFAISSCTTTPSRKIASQAARSASTYYHAVDDTHSPPDFRLSLQKVLMKAHLQAAGQPDELADACPYPPPQGKSCIKQKSFDYKQVRRVIMGDPSLGDIRQRADGDFEVFDYYCQTWRTKNEFIAEWERDKARVEQSKIDFAAGKTKKQKQLQYPEPAVPGLNLIVDSRVVNAEHTWPQSTFPNTPAEIEAMTSDPHHVFPTDDEENRLRAHHDLGDVIPDGSQTGRCGGRLGRPVGGAPQGSGPFFEPKAVHKGNAARALFYFSVRYNGGMSETQEKFLRRWHKEDPPDEREVIRNEAIYKVYGVRNPFIDRPEWVDKIPRFCRLKLNEGQAEGRHDCKDGVM